MASPRSRSQSDTWLSLGPASRLVGVGPETLRRWADEGRVAAFFTPGGHRRFSRRSLERLVRTATPVRASLARLGATPERLAAAYRRTYVARHRSSGLQAGTVNGARTGEPAGGTGAWGIPDPRRFVSPADRETFRIEGRQLIEALVRHLDAEEVAPAEIALADAVGLVETLGGRLARSGVSLTDAVTLFVAARRPFLAEIAAVGRRRALDPGRLAELYERASIALDRLLVVLVQAHRAAA